jgi:hypothetical protein
MPDFYLLQVAMQAPGDSEPFGSAAHCPVLVLQLYNTGFGAGVGGLVWFAHPPGTGAAKQPSQDGCVSHGLQHLSHTLQPVIGVLHEIVLLCWPQLCGTTHLQAAMHSPDDCDPVGSCAH